MKVLHKCTFNFDQRPQLSFSNSKILSIQLIQHMTDDDNRNCWSILYFNANYNLLEIKTFSDPQKAEDLFFSYFTNNQDYLTIYKVLSNPSIQNGGIPISLGWNHTYQGWQVGYTDMIIKKQDDYYMVGDIDIDKVGEFRSKSFFKKLESVGDYIVSMKEN